MNRPLLAAAALSALTICAHLFGGGPQYLAPFQTLLPNPELVSMATVLWHAVTACLFVFTLAYLWLSRHISAPLIWGLAAIQLIWAALFLGLGMHYLGNISVMPQWVIFIAIPALSLWGLKSAQTPRL